MTTKYRVQLLQDDTYQVLMISGGGSRNCPEGYDEQGGECVERAGVVQYQGSLSDCDAFIRLREKNYL